MKTYLIYFTDDDGYKGNILINGLELIKMVDESDFTGRSVTRVFEVVDPDNMKEIYYKGWQPNCVIEFVDNSGEVVLSGYGTDH